MKLNHNEMIVMEILLNHPHIGFYAISRFSKEQGYSFQIDDIHKILDGLQEKGIAYLAKTKKNKRTGEEIKRYSAFCTGEDYLNFDIQWYQKGLLGQVLANLVSHMKEVWILHTIMELSYMRVSS